MTEARTTGHTQRTCARGEPGASTWPTPGHVTIDAQPFAEVFHESMKLGETPLANIVLPAGCVRLKLIEVETKRAHERWVWVEPNEVLAYRCPLEVPTCSAPR